jgi:molybdopterin molybdotransferase
MTRIFSPASVQQAFDWTDLWSITPAIQERSLHQAVGYVLAQQLEADADIPPQALCARDGYAVQAADTLGAGDYNPLPLRLLSTDDTVIAGCTVQVSTGDRLPGGADAVLSLEQADVRNTFLDVAGSLAPGDGVVQVGEECARGEVLLSAGRRLRPQDLARLALAGFNQVKVLRKPRVHLILAGRFGRDADGPMLTALVARDGGDLIDVEKTSSYKELVHKLVHSDADLILVAGGTGYAASDQSVQALQDCGEVQLDGVTIHPGGGLVLGRITTKPVLLLPGAPLACLCAYDLIAARLLRHLAGRPGNQCYRSKTFTLSRKLVSRIGQLELARVKIDGEQVEALAVSDDRLLASSVRADGFVLLAENSEGYASGSEVVVYLYDE